MKTPELGELKVVKDDDKYLGTRILYYIYLGEVDSRNYPYKYYCLAVKDDKIRDEDVDTWSREPESFYFF